jgi:AcrR family transcriptional regulator
MPPPTPRHEKSRLARESVLDAAERLLRADPGATFSMRDLAEEAGVSFATPFNQYGSKAAIAHALSSRRITEMAERFRRAEPPGDAVERVLAAVRIAADLLLEEPAANRAMMGILGTWNGPPGAVSVASGALWSLALDDFEGLDTTLLPTARARLPGQLALVFRGCLSFWVSGEVTDTDLSETARAAAALCLAAFIEPARRPALLASSIDQPARV